MDSKKIEPKWVEGVLKAHQKKKEITSVNSVDVAPAVGKGENYTSDMYRIKIQVTLASGEKTTTSVLLKKHPKLTEKDKFMTEYYVHLTEIIVFSEILPKIEKLMTDHKDPSDRTWCLCLDFKPYDYLMLEDLLESGFKNSNRLGLLDLPHALITVRYLARFHAMSAILIHKGILDVNRLEPYVLSRNTEQMGLYLTRGLRMLARAMRQHWESKWAGAADKVEAFSNVVNQKLVDLWADKGNKMLVLCHGDCWQSNMLFKYELGSNHPIAMRLVDYQESHYNTCGWDLMYFFQLSLQPEFKDAHWTEMITEYWRSMSATFKFYNCTPDNAPSLEEIEEDVKRFKLMGFIVMSVFLPVVLANPEDTMDMERLVLEADEETIQGKMKMYRGEKFTEIAKIEMEHFMKIDL